MPRDNFISDNLINIRDHLRQNYQDMNHHSREETSQPSSGSREIHLDLKAPVVQATGNGRSSDREYNEFAGKLQHDQAAVSAEIRELKAKTENLVVFEQKLQDIAGELQKLQVSNSQSFFREFDHLKILFYQASGKAAVSRSHSNMPIQLPTEQSQVKVRRDWLLPVAVLLSALMICTTLLIVLG